MIQINLLPAVKLEYIKAQRQRRSVSIVAMLVTAGAIGLLLLLFSASALQRKHMSDLSKDIDDQVKTLQQKKDINKILTVQNQLSSLTGLHAGKPAAARLSDYLNNVTPIKVTISNLNVDFTAQTMIITGNADGLATVTKYVDTLKNTGFTEDGGDTQPAFSNVVMSSFGVNTGSNDSTAAANYTINLSYSPDIFDISKKVKLTVPDRTTTRSDQRTDLFKASPITTQPTTTTTTTPAQTTSGGTH